MAAGTYEYECMRAELLGMPRPDEEEFLAKQKERLEHQAEELEATAIEQIENESKDIKNVSGGLDELNSILSITQKKLNRFKSACGSLTNLLKIKVGHSDSESADSIQMQGSESQEKLNDNEENSDTQPVSCSDTQVPVQNGARKSDLSKVLDKQVDKLDSLLVQAENAQYSMAHQSKQMRSFLKK